MVQLLVSGRFPYGTGILLTSQLLCACVGSSSWLHVFRWQQTVDARFHGCDLLLYCSFDLFLNLLRLI